MSTNLIVEIAVVLFVAVSATLHVIAPQFVFLSALIKALAVILIGTKVSPYITNLYTETLGYVTMLFFYQFAKKQGDLATPDTTEIEQSLSEIIKAVFFVIVLVLL